MLAREEVRREEQAPATDREHPLLQAAGDTERL